MKKLLSVVLALAMILCMIPALCATTYLTISDKSYNIKIWTYGNASEYATASSANSIAFEYEYDDDYAVETGKWSDERVMALVQVSGFAFADFDPDEDTIYIDSKELTVASSAAYYGEIGAVADGTIVFPVELTEAGYTDSYSIKVVTTDANSVETTEKANITVKLVNTADEAKADKTAYISGIAVNSNYDDATAYIVGSKIYVDYVDEKKDVVLDITFADENKSAFTVITYANGVDVDGFTLTKKNSSSPYFTALFDDEDEYTRLSGSKGYYLFQPWVYDGDDIEFTLETEAYNYTVNKDYTVVARTNIHEADPKGVYLTSSAVTISVGQTYVPEMKSVSTGDVLVPTSVLIYDDTNTKLMSDIVDYANDSDDTYTLIGVKPGVAYIKCYYSKNYAVASDSFHYSTSTQKVTVVSESAASAVTTTTYTVSCRNLNVRKGPGTSYAKTGMVHRGETVEVVSVSDGWALLSDGTYVCYKYLTK